MELKEEEFLKRSIVAKLLSLLIEDYRIKKNQDLLVLPINNNSLKLLAFTWDAGFFYSDNNGNTWNKSSSGLTIDSQADSPKFKSTNFSDFRISNNFHQDKTIFLAGFDGSKL